MTETSQTGWDYSIDSVAPFGSITGGFGTLGNKNKFSVTAMNNAVDVANVTLKAVKGTTIILKVFTIAKQKQGTPGTNAKIVKLTSPTMSFSYSAIGTTPSPSGAVTITATAQNVVSPFYQFFEDSASQGSPTTTNTYSYTPEALYSNMPDTIKVEVREGSATGSIVATDTMPLIGVLAGASGANGQQTTSVELYYWSTVDPTTSNPPIGTTLYTWATAKHTNGPVGVWSTVVGNNPETSGIKLWVAKKSITAVATATDTSVTWDGNLATGSRSFIIYSDVMNGTNGTKTATANLYKWSITNPTAPTGSSVYTWGTPPAVGTFTTVPSGWSKTPPEPALIGHTLWQASAGLNAVANATTSTIFWTSATITPVGYAGADGDKGDTGANGANGAAGVAGLSYRLAYAKSTLATIPAAANAVTSSGIDSVPAQGSWVAGLTWSRTPQTLVAGDILYQSDGIFNPASGANGTITWNTPYMSTLKVGSLSAIAANMGTLTSGDIKVGTEPTITSVRTMTGSGTHLYSNGGFAMGTATTSIVYRGQSGDEIYLNGDVVATGNLQANSVTKLASVDDTSNFVFRYSTGGDGKEKRIITTTQTYEVGTKLTLLFTALKVASGDGDIEVLFNLKTNGGTLIRTFAGVSVGSRMVQSMDPPGSKVTATFSGSYTITSGDVAASPGGFKLEAQIYNSYSGANFNTAWTGSRLELIVLGAQR